MTGLESDSKYEFRVFVSNVAGRKREPAVKEFNVYSGVDVTPTPTDPGKISSFSQGRIWGRGGGGAAGAKPYPPSLEMTYSFLIQLAFCKICRYV